jgi:hypothetical protein
MTCRQQTDILSISSREQAVGSLRHGRKLAALNGIARFRDGGSEFGWTNGMTTSAVEATAVVATQVTVTDDTLTVELSDGRTISAPLAWYPRLLHGSTEERARWRLIGQGRGLHWLDLDEDVSVENLLAGKPSGESQRSFADWISRRAAGKTKSATA